MTEEQIEELQIRWMWLHHDIQSIQLALDELNAKSLFRRLLRI